MKVLLVSDLHLDWVTGGVERFAEVSAAVDQTVHHAIEAKVDMYAFLGDLTDPDVDSPLAHRAIAEAVRQYKRLEYAGIPSRWLVGNHDVIEDGRGSHTLMALQKAGAFVISQPSNEVHDGVEFIWLPYPSMTERYDPAAFVEKAALPGMRAYFVAGHMTRVHGVGAGSETHDMSRGRDIEFPIAAASKIRGRGQPGAKLVMANGHFHQMVTNGPVLIPGSVARLTHGEERNKPGYLIVEV